VRQVVAAPRRPGRARSDATRLNFALLPASNRATVESTIMGLLWEELLLDPWLQQP